MKRIFILLFAVLATMPLFAQQKGKVVFSLNDAANGTGVMGAVVEVYPTA